MLYVLQFIYHELGSLSTYARNLWRMISELTLEGWLALTSRHGMVLYICAVEGDMCTTSAMGSM